MKLLPIFISIRISLVTIVLLGLNKNAEAALRGEQEIERRLQTPSIVRLDLIHSSFDTVLQTLRDGDTVVLDNLGVTLPNLNVQAVTTGTGIASVTFALDGIANFRIEKVAPYALCGDTNSNYNSCLQLGIGKHTIAVQMSGTGGGVDGTTVTFTIIQSSMAPVLPISAPSLVPVASPVMAPAHKCSSPGDNANVGTCISSVSRFCHILSWYSSSGSDQYHFGCGSFDHQ
jgi:hypothetical protein